MLKRIWNRSGKSKIFLIVLFIIIFGALFVLRDDFQPYLLFVRKYIFIILFVLFVFLFSIYKIRRADTNGGKFTAVIIMSVIFGLLYFVGAKTGMYAFMQKYNIYKNLDLTEITSLPLSINERIQPFNNIRTMAYESIGETEEISEPQLVRIDGENRWTMVVQPAKEYTWQRVSDNIEEIFSVPSNTAFPRFAGENRENVIFSIGESLSFSRNTYNAVVQKFNPWQYLNLEPSEVFYMKNDQDQWVEVVSLIKWKGFLFPYPTFGGVMVIDNGLHTSKDYFERILFGKGKFISPEKMKSYPFLQKQNTLAEKVSRLQAESLMFLGGFTDPLPWNMHTSVKIPDLSDDQNQQPFVTDFDFAGIDTKAYTGLYHWFGLEPVGDERTSLSYSVFIPSDGSKHMMYYNHVRRKEGFAGVSAMPVKVMESKKNYDWTVNKPVEFRPYIKDIAGKRRMFVLSTVAAKRKDTRHFDGSSTPDLAIIDMEYRDVIWVDVKQPQQWDNTIFKQLGMVWKESEKDNEFFKNKPDMFTDMSSNQLNEFIENNKDNPLFNSNGKELSKDEMKAIIDSLSQIKSNPLTENKSQRVVDSVVLSDDLQKQIKKGLTYKEKIKKLEAELDSLKVRKLEAEIKSMRIVTDTVN